MANRPKSEKIGQQRPSQQRDDVVMSFTGGLPTNMQIFEASKPSRHSAVQQSSSKQSPDESYLQSVLKSFPRITRTPGVMGGKPCIKGSRMTVGMIVGQIGDGATIEELMDDFPTLKREDILEAIRYAGWYSGDMLLDLDPAA